MAGEQSAVDMYDEYQVSGSEQKTNILVTAVVIMLALQNAKDRKS
jgi:hypothetical protein